VKMPLRLALTIGRADEGAEWPGEIVKQLRHVREIAVTSKECPASFYLFALFAWRIPVRRTGRLDPSRPRRMPQHPAMDEKGEAKT